MFSRGDLLLVIYPYTDLTSSKRHRIVALTSCDAQGDFIALPVTSRSYHQNAFAVGAAELVAGTLPVASWVRTDHIFTLHVSLVAKRLGRVSEHVLSRVAEAVCRFIGHPQPVPPPTTDPLI